MSPKVDEEVDINFKSLSSNQVYQSNENQALKYQDNSHNFDSAIDNTTVFGYTDHSPN